MRSASCPPSRASSAWNASASRGRRPTWGKVAVWGFEPDTRLYEPRLTSGRWFAAGETDVALISDDLAAQGGLALGARLVLTTLGGGRSTSLRVIGTLDEPVDSLGQSGAIVLPVTDLYRFEGTTADAAPGYVNRVLVQATDRTPGAVGALAERLDARRDGPCAQWHRRARVGTWARVPGARGRGGPPSAQLPDPVRAALRGRSRHRCRRSAGSDEHAHGIGHRAAARDRRAAGDGRQRLAAGQGVVGSRASRSGAWPSSLAHCWACRSRGPSWAP